MRPAADYSRKMCGIFISNTAILFRRAVRIVRPPLPRVVGPVVPSR
jgi:hypothetical protein